MAGAAKRFDVAKSFKETKAEVKKVTWPNRKELLQHTEVVITSIILVGAVLWVIDFIFGKVLNLLIK
ncbi:MAG TPA: preprotein translocase subunit SecE [Bacillota bacterium]|nr:preprotein translocase subunit SecE [Clostridiaceae bacterium]HNR04129.1 preprotein translocase subunit SecE [Bacillota bacterium]HNT02768.1 preprotein translocase subunit SecE [Bacillota bacterium]HNU79330.1 preprotein translocase subunit SecE [Bacillota bacterium]HPM00043.1 preprotein translocase subunit SecE [Bacillota bacterium]